MPEQGVVLTRAGYEKLKRVVQQLEQSHKNLARRLRSFEKHKKASGMAIRIYVGKAASAINSGASGTVNIWIGEPGSETNSERTIASCFNRTSIDIDSGSWVLVTILGRRKYVEPWECPV